MNRELREATVAWIVTVLASLYCAWLGIHLARTTAVLGKTFEGLGAQLPASTQFVVANSAWLCPILFGGLVVGLLFKEAVMRDKRLSTMLSLIATIVAQLIAQWFMTACYLPLFELMKAVG